MKALSVVRTLSTCDEVDGFSQTASLTASSASAARAAKTSGFTERLVSAQRRAQGLESAARSLNSGVGVTALAAPPLVRASGSSAGAASDSTGVQGLEVAHDRGPHR